MTPRQFTRWYSNRIGDPATDGEARGYWLFALGIILGVVGVGMLVAGDLRGAVPQWPVVLAATALLLLIAGPLMRLPLRRLATLFVYGGTLVGLVAMVWFVGAYPGWRPQASRIIGLYSLGLFIMAIGGVVVPILTSRADLADDLQRQETEIVRQREELAAVRDEIAENEANEEEVNRLVEQLQSNAADAEADENEIAARLTSVRSSRATFELYPDAEGQWRWRLRHRNGNIIADSGEGYTRKHNAKKGLRSVQQNALGAGVAESEV